MPAQRTSTTPVAVSATGRHIANTAAARTMANVAKRAIKHEGIKNINDTRNWRLTNSNKAQHLWTYRDAIKRCDSFIRSSDYAKSLDPDAELDYIPMEERWGCTWVDDDHLWCPKRGALKWVGVPWMKPRKDEDMQRTKLFVVDKFVAERVEWVVRAAKKEREEKNKGYPEWVVKSSEWWIRASDLEEWGKKDSDSGHEGLNMDLRRLRKATEESKEKVPKGYHHVLREISVSEILIKGKANNWTKAQFWDWLDQRASDHEDAVLAKAMEALEVEMENERKEKELEKLKWEKAVAAEEECLPGLAGLGLTE